MDELFRRIEEKIRSEANPLTSAEYKAQRCLHLIRYGEFARARIEIQLLRGDFGNGMYPRISIWIFILEGLLLYFENLDHRASDRILRAAALSNSLAIRDLAGISNAWLAHIYFTYDNCVGMGKCIGVAARQVESASDSWLTRVALVVADAAQFAGQWEQASRWYEAARHAAVDAGDRLSIGSVIYNRLNVGLSRLRAQAVLQLEVEKPLRRWVTEANSSEYFHRGLAMNALPELLTLCHARAAFVEGDYESASRYILQLIENNCASRCSLTEAALLAELAVCQLQMGNTEAARAHLQGIEFSSGKSLAADDRLVFQANFIEISRAVDSGKSLAQEERALRETEREYLNVIKLLNEQLASLSETLEQMQQRIRRH